MARPINGIFGLLALASLPLIGMFSSALLVMLVLKNGFRAALLQALAAAGLLGLASLLGDRNPAVVVMSMAAIWSPGLVLVAVLMTTRSLTLSLQVSVLVTALLVSLFHAVVPDVSAFWSEMLTQVAAGWRQQGQEEMAAVVEQLLPFAAHMTLTIVLSLWIVHTGLFSLGYALYRRIPDDLPSFGSFSALDFGKVIAITMAIASLVAMLLDAAWLTDLAFFLYAIFWLQGLAVLHYLQSRKKAPGVLLVFVYATLVIPPINAIALMLLALIGYADAWFNFRRARTT